MLEPQCNSPDLLMLQCTGRTVAWEQRGQTISKLSKFWSVGGDHLEWMVTISGQSEFGRWTNWIELGSVWFSLIQTLMSLQVCGFGMRQVGFKMGWVMKVGRVL